MSAPSPPRKKSFFALDVIRSTNALEQNELRFYEALFDHGPATGKQIERILAEGNGITFSEVQIAGSSLLRKGCVERIGTRHDDGCLVALWDVTATIPTVSVPVLPPDDAETATKKPTAEDLTKSAEEIRQLISRLRKYESYTPSEHLVRVGKWIASGAKSRRAAKAKTSTENTPEDLSENE